MGNRKKKNFEKKKLLSSKVIVWHPFLFPKKILNKTGKYIGTKNEGGRKEPWHVLQEMTRLYYCIRREDQFHFFHRPPTRPPFLSVLISRSSHLLLSLSYKCLLLLLLPTFEFVPTVIHTDFFSKKIHKIFLSPKLVDEQRALDAPYIMKHTEPFRRRYNTF